MEAGIKNPSSQWIELEPAKSTMLDQVFLLLLACEFYKITEGEILIENPVTLIVYNRIKLLDLIKLNLEKAAVCSLISNRGRAYIKC